MRKILILLLLAGAVSFGVVQGALNYDANKSLPVRSATTTPTITLEGVKQQQPNVLLESTPSVQLKGKTDPLKRMWVAKNELEEEIQAETKAAGITLTPEELQHLVDLRQQDIMKNQQTMQAELKKMVASKVSTQQAGDINSLVLQYGGSTNSFEDYKKLLEQQNGQTQSGQTPTSQPGTGTPQPTTPGQQTAAPAQTPQAPVTDNEFQNKFTGQAFQN